MSKLIILKGLPSSGKSTKAKELVAQGNTVRINKDLIREMIHWGKKWNGKDESLTKYVSRNLAVDLLNEGLRVVIDDTNLNLKTLASWRELANEMNVNYEIIKIDTPYETCIEWDSKREKQVGKSVIIGMAMQADLYTAPKKGIVACDIDGSVANIDHRLKYISNGNKDWKSFFDAMILDQPRMDIFNKLMLLYVEGYEIFFVSGRPDAYRKQTENWLNMYFKPWKALFMRRNGDRRQDYKTKTEIFNTYFKHTDWIYKVFDDRVQVICDCWIPLLGKEKIVDVGNNKYFVEERKKYNYYTK